MGSSGFDRENSVLSVDLSRFSQGCFFQCKEYQHIKTDIWPRVFSFLFCFSIFFPSSYPYFSVVYLWKQTCKMKTKIYDVLALFVDSQSNHFADYFCRKSLVLFVPETPLYAFLSTPLSRGVAYGTTTVVRRTQIDTLMYQRNKTHLAMGLARSLRPALIGAMAVIGSLPLSAIVTKKKRLPVRTLGGTPLRSIDWGICPLPCALSLPYKWMFSRLWAGQQSHLFCM